MFVQLGHYNPPSPKKSNAGRVGAERVAASAWLAIGPMLKHLPGLRPNIIKKDAGRTRGRSARLATPCAPPAEAPDHGCRRDWEGRVSCQENVLFLFSRPELLGLAGLVLEGTRSGAASYHEAVGRKS